MAFAIVPLFIAAYEHTKDKNISAFVFSLLAAALLMWGCYLAWNEEHRNLQLELAKNAHPEFEMEVSKLIHDVTPTKGTPWLDCGNTYVAKLSVVNVRDSPSSVKDIYVTLGDGSKKFSAQPFQMAALGWTKDGPLRRFPSGETYTEPKYQTEIISDLLPSILDPMTRGSHKDGWVCLTDMPSVGESGIFKFYVVDAYGGEHGPFTPKAEMDLGNVKRT